MNPLRVAPIVLLAIGFLTPGAGHSQDAKPSEIRLSGVYPTGYRTSVTERWTPLSLSVVNLGDADKIIRVVAYYEGQPDNQYARIVRVPAQSSVSSWLTMGPASTYQKALIGREINMLLYDLTDGKEELILPKGEERYRARAIPYRKQEATTAAFIDDHPNPDNTSFRQPTYAEDVVSLARVVRGQKAWMEHVHRMPEADLPNEGQALDGIDHLIIASKRIGNDAVSLAAIRRWVEQGGLLWVMLDRVDAEMLAPIFGEGHVPEIVGRTSLEQFRMARRMEDNSKNEVRTFDHPVPFARVALSGRETILCNIDGWPAAFVIRIGRGKVLCTTVGPTGWMRPRRMGGERMPEEPKEAPKELPPGPPGKGAFGKGAFGKGLPAQPKARPVSQGGDPPSPFTNIPNLPVGFDSLDDIVTEFLVAEHPFQMDDLRDLLTDEIGYTVPPRSFVGAILGGFIAILIAIALLLRRSKQTGIVGWFGPAAAVVASGVLVSFALVSRHAIPATAATVEIIDVVPGVQESSVRGLFATYRPDSGPVTITSHSAAILDLDRRGLEGQIYRRSWSDWNRWSDENIALPAGVRTGTFQATRETGTLAARVRFGKEGLVGEFTRGPFHTPEDSLLLTTTREVAGLELSADGKILSKPTDTYAPGQYLASAVLTDRQQRRLEIYRKLLKSPLPEHLAGREFLLTWATPEQTLFDLGPDTRTVGSSLLIVPLDFVRTDPGQPVTVPRTFLPSRRVLNGNLLTVVPDGIYPHESRIRFQIPPSVQPMTITKAVVHAKIRANSRTVTLSGYDGDTPVKLSSTDSPIDTYTIEITDPKFLKPDATGGLHLGIAISGGLPGQPPADTKWEIETLGVEIQGTTSENKP
jgi:hypothetical protein